MRHTRTRHGLRVTVRLYGGVVEQRVHWVGRSGVEIGGDGPDAVPTPSGGALVVVRAIAPGRLQVEPVEPTATPGILVAGNVAAGAAGAAGADDAATRWHWTNGDGLDVDLDLVPRIPASRRASQPGGDVALLVMVLMLMIGVSQASTIIAILFPGSSGGAGETVHEPTPELLARLLDRDLEGEEDGAPERVERAHQEQGFQGYYMPAGQEDGSLARNGGGKDAGDAIVRAPKDEDEPEDAPEELAVADAESPDLEGDLPQLEVAEAPAAPEQQLLAGNEDEPLELEDVFDKDDPVERFIGWGFRDWFDVRDARPDVEEQWARHLEIARRRLAIDPDDPAALNVVGYYAYLAENPQLAEQTYRRYTELYPEDPAGYNNLALTYKRTGEFAKEEALYREALELDPLDPHVLNNLAVNLAHQGRHDEALRIMEQLEQLDPADPYADLHRAKIYASMGKKAKAYRFLEAALEGVAQLDTMHHIEFRQDIRIDPAFDTLRGEKRFVRILDEYYGEEADYLVRGTPPGRRGG